MDSSEDRNSNEESEEPPRRRMRLEQPYVVLDPDDSGPQRGLGVNRYGRSQHSTPEEELEAMLRDPISSFISRRWDVFGPGSPAPSTSRNSSAEQLEEDLDENLRDPINFFLARRRNAIAEGSPLAPSTSSNSSMDLPPSPATAPPTTSIDRGVTLSPSRGIIPGRQFPRQYFPHSPPPEEDDNNSTPPLDPVYDRAEDIEVVQVVKEAEKNEEEDEAGKGEAEVDGDKETSTCLICFDPFTNSGEHRVTCLKCGHLFGKNCIIKWLKSQPRCPQCNSAAKAKDVRVIFARNLVAIDTSERDEALKELEEVKTSKRKLELEVACMKIRFDTEVQRVKDLEDQVAEMRQIGCRFGKDLDGVKQVVNPWEFKEEKIINLGKAQLRVGAYSVYHSMALVSMSTAHPIFPNGCHGFRTIRLDCVNTPNGEFGVKEMFHTLHHGEVRDLAFSPTQRDTLLSVGMDKRAIVSSLTTMNPVQTYIDTSAVWSSAWHHSNSHAFLTGHGNGTVKIFDLRMPTQVLSSLTIPGDKSPITRILHFPSSTTNPAGYLIQRSSSLHFMDAQENLTILPFSDPIVSVAVDPESRHFLLSMRGSLDVPNASHHLCTLAYEAGGPKVVSKIIDTIHSPCFETPLLTRSTIWSLPTATACTSNNVTKMFMAVPEAQHLRVWNRENKNLPRIPHAELIRDVFPMRAGNKNFIGTISLNSFNIFSYKS